MKKYLSKNNIKKISIISFCLVFLVFFYSLSFKKDRNVISTMSVPVTKKRIIIDAGHGRRRSVEQLVRMV